MIIIDDIKVGQSFSLYLESFVTKKVEAFKTYSGPLFLQEDNRLPSGVYAYASPYQQMVYDSAVTGSSICSGIFESGNFLPRNSGLVVDFYNGRVLSNRTIVSPSGNFSIKECNWYISNENLEKLLIDSSFVASPDVENFLTGASIPYSYTLPAAILSVDSSQATDFALGGEKKEDYRATAVILSEDIFTRDTFLGACKLTHQRGFQLYGNEDTPINESGDYKTGGYDSRAFTRFDVSIENVRVDKLKDRATEQLPNSLYIGFAHFDLRRISFFQ